MPLFYGGRKLVYAIARGLVSLPATPVGALVLAAGLALYVVGMFSALADRRGV